MLEAILRVKCEGSEVFDNNPGPDAAAIESEAASTVADRSGDEATANALAQEYLNLSLRAFHEVVDKAKSLARRHGSASLTRATRESLEDALRVVKEIESGNGSMSLDRFRALVDEINDSRRNLERRMSTP